MGLRVPRKSIRGRTIVLSRTSFCSARLLRFLFSISLIGLFLAACDRSSQSSLPLPGGDEWRQFQGTWIAAGERQTIRLGADRRALIAKLSGSLLLSGASRPAVGFSADAIVLSDTATGAVGRAVWTNHRGDQIYSALQGEAAATGKKITGTFVGTGRYAEATGTYEFVWRFVIDTEDGHVQGQSENLNGRVRLGSPPAISPGGPHP